MAGLVPQGFGGGHRVPRARAIPGTAPWMQSEDPQALQLLDTRARVRFHLRGSSQLLQTKASRSILVSRQTPVRRKRETPWKGAEPLRTRVGWALPRL